MIPKKPLSFLNLIILLCAQVFGYEKSSLVFVVDDTNSMQPIINSVKAEVNRIFDAYKNSPNSQIKNFVLVAFNDYDDFGVGTNSIRLAAVTENTQVFETALSKLYAHEGSNCPEYSMSGILSGIQNSAPRSSIYVFTDADAKDSYRYTEVRDLAVKKQSKISIFLIDTIYCPTERANGKYLYQQLAIDTGGTLFEVTTHILSQVITDIVNAVRGPRTDLVNEEFKNGYGTFNFDLDDLFFLNNIILTVTGKNPSLNVIGPDGTNAPTTTNVNTENVLIKTLDRTTPGRYTGTAQTSTPTHVRVSAQSEVLLLQGFSTAPVTSLSATTSTPAADIESHIYIQVAVGNVVPEQITIIDYKTGRELKKIDMHITNPNEKLYSTELVDIPSNVIIKLAVYCKDPNTGKHFISKLGYPLQSHPRPIEAPRITYSNNTVTIISGHELRLSCKATGFPNPAITWQVKHKNSNVFEQRPDTGDLIMPTINYKQAGLYKCIATNNIGTDNRIIEVIVHETPKITDSKNSVTIMNGQKLRLTCTATGFPDPVITWQVKHKNSNVFEERHGTGDLTVSKINYEQAGLYKCIATNIIGTDNRITDVIVHGEPKITNVDSTYKGVTGDDVLRIVCEVTGVPEPTIVWKHGNEVVTSNSKITISKDEIFIKDPTEADSSKYTCEAKNIYGDAAKTFYSAISDDIFWDPDRNTNFFIKVGESLDIECLTSHSDPNSIRWYVNGELSYVSGKTYSLKNAKFENDGNYTCRVNTDQGSESLNYAVDVGYEPTFKMDLSPTVIWHGNQEESLDCDVNGKPGGDVKWAYNGKELNGNSAELTIISWGTYSCKVSNVHGSVQRTFNVTSDGCVVNRTAVRVKHTPLLIGDKASSWPRFDRDNEFLTINKNEIINLECSTQEQPANTFETHPTDKIIHAKCLSEDNFIVNGETLKFEELQCKETVRASQVFTKKSCMKTGELIEIGFQLSNGFLGVYSVCYSNVDHETLFTKVDMLDVNLGNKVESSFKLNDGAKSASKNPGEIMKCQYNQRWFVSPVDVAFGPAQTATLMFDKYNTVPVYEPCDGSSRMSWSKVENIIRSSLDDTYTLTSWTGASNYNSQGIPRYLWKVVMFGDTFETMVYVNDPNPIRSDIVCDKTRPNRLADVMAVTEDEYTYSCSVDDLITAFGIPKDEIPFK